MRLSFSSGKNSRPESQPARPLTVLALLLLSLFSLAPAGEAQSPNKTSSASLPADKAATAKSRPVAVVDGKEIGEEEVENALAAQLTQLEEQIYQLKRQRLEALISDKLLSLEATRRGVPLQSLLDAEVTAKTAAITDQDVTSFYQANRGQLGQLDANLIERIKNYLFSQRLNARREEFVGSLRAKTKVAIHLPPPVSRLIIPIEGAPILGEASAPITIVEFSDFHCPFCIRVQPALKQVLARYGNQVKLVYRHSPLDQLHPQARAAAEASVCAQQQGKFWPYHDQLYAAGTDANPEKLRGLAQTVGLDLAAFDQCLFGGKQRQIVQKDSEEAARLGVNGTPAFFVNGRMLSGAQPVENFARVIDEELARLAPSQPSAGEKKP